LFSLVLPLLLGHIGRQVNAAGGGAASLLNLLGEQRSLLRDAPSGLMSLLGGSAPSIASAATPAATVVEAARTVGAKQRPSPWLWALPALFLIPLLAYFMGRGRQDVQSTVQGTADVPRAVATAGTAAAGALVDRALPDSTTLRVPANGFESRLLAYIQDSSQTPGRETWFTFDRLEFDPDSATLRPDASEQLANVAAIMKAYPNVKMTIGGYTDNTADSAHNLELSQSRAHAAMDHIVSQGVDASRLSAEGYGDQHPVADNSTPEGRQQNRRVDIRVTDK
jgi:outer membrane protein OmpA-like peptidoglycan-associated protein